LISKMVRLYSLFFGVIFSILFLGVWIL